MVDDKKYGSGLIKNTYTFWSATFIRITIIVVNAAARSNSIMFATNRVWTTWWWFAWIEYFVWFHNAEKWFEIVEHQNQSSNSFLKRHLPLDKCISCVWWRTNTWNGMTNYVTLCICSAWTRTGIYAFIVYASQLCWTISWDLLKLK